MSLSVDTGDPRPFGVQLSEKSIQRHQARETARKREGLLRLCYVDSPWAYFSSAKPSDVWGDDWNDAPHDCNAGSPYADRAPDLTQVAFDGDLWIVGAGAFGGYVAQRWGWLSVEQINRGDAPWLVKLVYAEPMEHDIEIRAGATLEEFKSLVARAGGHVYEVSNVA